MLGSKQTKMARRNWLAVCTILVTMATLMIVAKLAHCDQGQDCSQHLEPQSKSSQLAALVSATKGKASKGTPSLDIVRNIVRGALEGELIKDDDCSDEMGKLKKLVEMLEAREQCYKGSRIAMGIHSLVEFVKEHANVVKPPGSIHAATGGDGGHQVQLLLEQLNQKNQELAARDEQIKLVQSEKADMQVQLNQRDQELSSERKLIEELSQIVANLEKQLLDCESSAGGAGGAGAAGADSSIETNEREIPNPYADQMRQLAEEEERKKRENKPRRQRHIVQTWYS